MWADESLLHSYHIIHNHYTGMLSCPLSSMSLSESVRDLQVALNKIVNLQMELNDKKLIDDVKVAVQKAKKVVSDATGGALHGLDETNPSIDAIKQLVERIPDALSCKNEDDLLPIQSAFVYGGDAIKYVPILAKEGIKLKIGGRGMRGGLLMVDPADEDGLNTLQLFLDVYFDENPIPCDTRLDVMKELRKDSIILKKDIKDHNHLYFSCFPELKMMIDYLAEWDPDNLMTGTYRDLPLSHAVIERGTNIKLFNMFLATSLKHHPQHLGLLFQKDYSGQTDSLRKSHRETWT